MWLTVPRVITYTIKTNAKLQVVAHNATTQKLPMSFMQCPLLRSSSTVLTLCSCYFVVINSFTCTFTYTLIQLPRCGTQFHALQFTCEIFFMLESTSCIYLNLVVIGYWFIFLGWIYCALLIPSCSKRIIW